MPLHENETRKQAFGLDAEAYDAARPRYPRALIERIAEHASLGPESRALEIGCGTGIATLPFAKLGCSLRAIELSEAMAAVAHAKLANFPRVVIETTRFEDWSGDGDFDLVFCAQAWHWLPPHARYEKTRALLREGGTLAVFANWDAAVLEEVQPVYRRHGLDEPHGHAREEWDETWWPDIARGIEDVRAAITASGAYRDIEFHRFPWERTFDAQPSTLRSCVRCRCAARSRRRYASRSSRTSPRDHRCGRHRHAPLRVGAAPARPMPK